MNAVAVVVVVGDGALGPLAGAPIVVHSVESVLRVVDRVLVVAPARLVTAVTAACDGLPVDVGDWLHGRQRAGTARGDEFVTPGSVDVVVVHDAARPLAPPSLTAAVVDAVRSGHRAVVPVLALTDTVKLVDAEHRLRATPDRAGLRVVQTPQAFGADLAAGVLAAARRDPTHAWTAAGPAVHTVPGDPLAFPVRGAWDLELATMLVGDR